MSEDNKKDPVITKQTTMSVSVVLIIVAAVVFTVKASISADGALQKVNTLEDSMRDLALAQTKLTNTTNLNQQKIKDNSMLLRKLSEVQLQQQLNHQTQKVELKYIKEGIRTILRKGG